MHTTKKQSSPRPRGLPVEPFEVSLRSSPLSKDNMVVEIAKYRQIVSVVSTLGERTDFDSNSRDKFIRFNEARIR